MRRWWRPYRPPQEVKGDLTTKHSHLDFSLNRRRAVRNIFDEDINGWLGCGTFVLILGIGSAILTLIGVQTALFLGLQAMTGFSSGVLSAILVVAGIGIILTGYLVDHADHKRLMRKIEEENNKPLEIPVDEEEKFY